MQLTITSVVGEDVAQGMTQNALCAYVEAEVREDEDEGEVSPARDPTIDSGVSSPSSDCADTVLGADVTAAMTGAVVADWMEALSPVAATS